MSEQINTIVEVVFRFPMLVCYIIGLILIAVAVVMLSSLAYGVLTLGIGAIVGGIAKHLDDL